MISEEEMQKTVDETTALLRETAGVFNESIRGYFVTLAADIKRCAKTGVGGKLSAEALKELASISADSVKIKNLIMRHSIITQRALKVVVHKNEVKAYERLRTALDRMQQEAKDFQAEMRKLAIGKIVRKVN